MPDTNELRIDGQIGSDWWSDGVTSEWVRDQLGRIQGDVTIWLNSPGGDVIEGSQIYTAIKEHKGSVRICIDGIAASAASVIAMAADELCMSPSAYLMIHRASTVAMGNVDEMDEASRQLHAIDEGIIDAYRTKTNLSRTKILKLMEDETWLNASAAIKLGFADTLLYSGAAGDEPDEGGTDDEDQTLEARLHALHRMRPAAMVYASAGHAWSPDRAALPAQGMPKPPAPQQEPNNVLNEVDRAKYEARMALLQSIYM